MLTARRAEKVSRDKCSWLVAWTGEVLTAGQVGRNGMTSYLLLRRKAWQPRPTEFGELFLYQARTRPDVDLQRHFAVYLGHPMTRDGAGR